MNLAAARAVPATRYLYSANRLKYPMMRKRLMKMWREAKALHSDPIEAWASIIEDADKAKSFKQARGRGGFVRSSRQEVNELIAASNVYTIKTTARTVSLASRQFRQCRWFLTRRVRVISRCLAVLA